MNVNEALSYEEGEIAKTTHNVCTRQLKDDANRLKCRKNQQKKERRYLLMIRKTMKDAGDSEYWRTLRAFLQKEVRAFANTKKSDGTVE